MTTIVKTSLNTATTLSVKNSLRASTSLVLRTIRRPIGVRSKNPTVSFWRWANISERTSRMAHWPTICVVQLWA